MKTLYKFLGLTLLISISLYACKKELSALPPNAKVDANTVVDQATAQIALNGAYYAFANATQAQTFWQDHQIRPGMLAGYLSYGFSTYPEEDNRNTSFMSHHLLPPWSSRPVECFLHLNLGMQILINALLRDIIRLAGLKSLLNLQSCFRLGNLDC